MKRLLSLAFLLAFWISNAQMYKGFEFDANYDKPFGTGGVLYMKNDIKISFSVKPVPGKTEKCRSNFPNFSGGNNNVMQWYYISVSVHNGGKYPVRFMGVPTFSMYMKGRGEKTARKYCTNPGVQKTVNLDLRSIGPDGSIEFNDPDDGAFFVYAEGMPSLHKFSMSHYKIVNPNVDSSLWANMNYRDYEKKYGKKKGKSSDDLLDDFASELENDLNNTQTKKKNTTKEYVKNKTKEKAKKVTVNNSINSSRNQKNKTSVNKNYSAASCQSLKNQANSVYKSVLSLIRNIANGKVNYSMSQTNVMNQQMDRFSKQYISAIKKQQLSPKCQREISNIMDRYTNEFTKFINRYTNGMLNKY